MFRPRKLVATMMVQVARFNVILATGFVPLMGTKMATVGLSTKMPKETTNFQNFTRIAASMKTEASLITRGAVFAVLDR